VSATITSVAALITALLASIPQIIKVLADRKRGIREAELQKSKQDAEYWNNALKTKDVILDQYKAELARLYKRVAELEAELDEE
jgi:heme exporter protein D